MISAKLKTNNREGLRCRETSNLYFFNNALTLLDVLTKSQQVSSFKHIDICCNVTKCVKTEGV